MKIGIVNDSMMAAEVLRRVVEAEPSLEVMWMAEDGFQAVRNCRESRPDLILMDLLMPVMDGVEATRRITRDTPCAILIVTSSVNDNASLVFEAMGAGAMDAVATPVLGDSGNGREVADLLHKIRIIARLINCPLELISTEDRRGRKDEAADQLVVIGASTGGPPALAAILADLPCSCNVPVVVIQHMDKKFTPGLVNWLNQQIDLPVQLINEGDMPQKGIVMLPNTNVHLQMTRQGRFSYSIEPEENFYHPSVDVFFETLAAHWQGEIIAALLTGMGRDGARGLLTIKNRGGYTIAQDRESSVVYGMPKAAAEIDAAREILPMKEIGSRILQLLTNRP